LSNATARRPCATERGNDLPIWILIAT